MSLEFIYPEFEVIRNTDRCITCRICERQCANEVHTLNKEKRVMVADETQCVNCQRCVSFCPTRALKIVKSDCTFRENANWQSNTIKEIYKQANSGGVIIVLGLEEKNKNIIGFFPCTGMHGGKMFLRSECKDVKFPRQVTARLANESDMDELKTYLIEYCDLFGYNINEVLASPFTVVTPDSNNPYKQMYVEN